MIAKLKLLQLIFFSRRELKKKYIYIFFTLAYPLILSLSQNKSRQYPGVENAHNLGLNKLKSILNHCSQKLSDLTRLC